MSQSINSQSSPKNDLKAVADVDTKNASKVSQESMSNGARTTGKGLKIVWVSVELVSVFGRQGKLILVPTDTPLKTPQEWEPELSDFDFDFTASPGAEDWQVGETADGRAVYSTVSASGVGVAVEFQKWDW
ncbi:hypothetical protein FS837_001069 [Tulasnella sp. UAMH 9824]|nr:hypothetical protein FS837_001069 [Tulasnella sp. UAMH 9824]